mgnify:CR=1 FL=1
MTMRTNCILLLAILLGAFPLNRVHADESGSIILYTPYTKISVTPGASIDYSIDLINNTDGITNANLSVNGLPGSWKHEIKSGGWTLSQLSVLPQEKKTFNLKVEVPLKVNKGSYHFTVFAGETKLPLEVVVAQKGTYQTEFTTDQPNMQGNSKSTFTFNATLKNQTADQHNLIIIGAGNLGQAIANYANFEKRGFMIKGMFDINPRLIGLVVRGIEIRGVDDLEQFIKDNDVQMAALTIPKTKAPELADRLVNAGIKGIWNFAHLDLNVPDDVVVENVHLSESLMRLSYRVCNMQDERERKAKEKAEQTGTNETC